MRQISAAQLAAWLADDQKPAPLLLDVREPWEFQICHIERSQLMPMASVPARVEELDRDVDIVVICHHGARSAQVCMFLEHQGVAGWAAQVDPRMPQY